MLSTCFDKMLTDITTTRYMLGKEKKERKKHVAALVFQISESKIQLQLESWNTSHIHNLICHICFGSPWTMNSLLWIFHVSYTASFQVNIVCGPTSYMGYSQPKTWRPYLIISCIDLQPKNIIKKI